MAFEPNPKHAEHLQGLAESYATCGIKVTLVIIIITIVIMVIVVVFIIIMIIDNQVLVFNNTGVGHKDTTSSFAPFNTLLGHEVCFG